MIAIDIDDRKLALARELGALATLNGSEVSEIPQAVSELSRGGVHVSLDALGHPTTCYNSIQNLRPRGKHIQVGLMLAEHASPKIPMAKVIAQELEILGSHGMQAYRYDAMLDMVESGRLDPSRLIGDRISLSQAPDALTGMDKFQSLGATVITF